MCLSFINHLELNGNDTYNYRFPPKKEESIDVCVHLCVCACVSHSVVSDSATPWTVYHHISLTMEFSSQEYWSGLLCLFLGDLPHSGIKPRSSTLQIDSLLSEPPGNLESIGTSKNRGQVL